MTLYITPTGRLVRRTNWNAMPRNEQPAEEEVNVLVPINVKSEADDYVITALVPGVKADDLSIQVHDETLTIQGELKEESKENEKFLLREMPVGKFYRTIRLPEKLDSSKAVADLNDGVLTLRLTKAEEARPKTIKVSVN
jgi:HSP20 family protein